MTVKSFVSGKVCVDVADRSVAVVVNCTSFAGNVAAERSRNIIDGGVVIPNRTALGHAERSVVAAEIAVDVGNRGTVVVGNRAALSRSVFRKVGKDVCNRGFVFVNDGAAEVTGGIFFEFSADILNGGVLIPDRTAVAGAGIFAESAADVADATVQIVDNAVLIVNVVFNKVGGNIADGGTGIAGAEIHNYHAAAVAAEGLAAADGADTAVKIFNYRIGTAYGVTCKIGADDVDVGTHIVDDGRSGII